MAKTPLSKYLKMLRIKHGYTQEELSQKLGLTRSNYSHYETGFSNTPNDILHKLSKLYNIPLVNFIRLSALSGNEQYEEAEFQAESINFDGVFVSAPDSTNADPLYIDFIRNFPEMNDKELRKWMSPEDMELIYNYHKLSPKNRNLAMYILKLLVIHGS